MKGVALVGAHLQASCYNHRSSRSGIVVRLSNEMLLQPHPAPVPPSVLATMAAPRTVLLTSTSWWAFTARMAMRFAALGWRVEAVCPPGHPLRKTGAVDRVHDYPALRPLAALQAAIASTRPDFIVPCDDRSVMHLHDLHARLRKSATSPAHEAAALIAHSLGRVDSFPITERRSDLIRVAREEGLSAPETRVVESEAALHEALEELGLPAVLKVDGSWGGLSTVVVSTAAQAEQARRLLARPLNAIRAIKRLLCDRDPYHLLPWLAGSVPRVNVQAYVPGRPANTIAACWNGEVLACIHAEVLSLHRTIGPSTVVRVIDHPEMARTTERLTRRLGLSGFYGFDFMLNDATGSAHLIEMNPRSTPLCHFALGAGSDPIAALTARLSGTPLPMTAPVTGNPVIAFFPQAWLSDPESNFLRSGYHDVPWEDPALVKELLRQPYPDRGLLARLLVHLRRGRTKFPELASVPIE